MKSFKAQVYYESKEKLIDSTKNVTIKNYIYSEDVYKSGGLWCDARYLSSSESVSNGLSVEKTIVKFTFNSNDKITNKCKILFKGKVYSINGDPDRYSFNKYDNCVVTAIETGDTTKYYEERYEG